MAIERMEQLEQYANELATRHANGGTPHVVDEIEKMVSTGSMAGAWVAARVMELCGEVPPSRWLRCLERRIQWPVPCEYDGE